MREGTSGVGARISRILEVNIAVRDLDSTRERFRAMGLSDVGVWEVVSPPVEARTTSFPISESNLSLIEPLHEGDPIARFLDRRGEGLFSVTLLVDGIHEIVTSWRSLGIEFVLEEPLEMRDVRIAGAQIPLILENWTRPSTLNGFVIELQDHRYSDGRPRFGW